MILYNLSHNMSIRGARNKGTPRKIQGLYEALFGFGGKSVSTLKMSSVSPQLPCSPELRLGLLTAVREMDK